MVNISELSVKIGVDDRELTAGLNRANQSVQGFGGQLAGVGAAVTTAFAAAGAGIAAGLAVGVKAAGDLQQSVANISTIKPEIDTSAVFGALNEMSTRIPATASELGESLYNVFSSMDVGQEAALELVETFAKGAAGAGTSAETFGTAAMGVMNAYGLTTKEAAAVSDMFFDTINKGVVTGDELAASLGPVTQSAKAAGVAWRDLGPMIAAVTKEGGPAAQNMNNLNNLFQKFTTSSAQLAMNNMGVATVDAAGKFREVPAVLTDLKAHLATLTEAEAAAALQEIFPDAQARIGAQTLMSQIDFVNEALKSNQEASGSTAAAYEKMSATFNSQSKLLVNNLMSIATAIGAELLPHITPLITALSKSLPAAFQDLKDSVGTVKQVLAGEWAPDSSIRPFTLAVGNAAVMLRDTFGPAVQAVAGFVTGTLIPAVQQFAAPITAFVAGFTGSIVVMGLAAAAFGVVATALGFLLSPLGLVAIAVGLLAVAWTENMLGIQEATAALIAAVGPYFQELVTIIQTALSGDVAGAFTDFMTLVRDVAAQLGPLLLLWAQEFIAWIAPMIPPMLAALGEVAAAVLAWLAEQIPPIMAQLLLWGQEFVAWVAPQIPPLIAALTTLGLAMIDWVIGQVPGITAKLVEWGILFGAWVLTTAIPELVKALPGIATTLFDWAIQTEAVILTKLVALGQAIATGIVNGFTAAWATIGPKIQEAIANAFKIPEIRMPRLEWGSGSGLQTQSFSNVQGAPVSEDEIDAYIAQAFAARGHDPQTAIAVSRAERSSIAAMMSGDSGSSFGPFQLHMGGLAPGGNAGSGMGDAFRSATGLDPRDISTWRQQVDYVAANLSQTGWQPFHAAANRGIGNRQGVGSGVPMVNAPMTRIPLSGGMGGDPSQWPGFMNQVNEQLPDYLLSLDTIQQAGTLAFNGTAQAGTTSGAALVSATTDSLGNVTRIYAENGVAIASTVTNAAGQITNSWQATGAAVIAQAQTSGAGLITATTDSLGTVTRIYAENGVALGATVTNAAGVIVNTWGTMGTSVVAGAAATATEVIAQATAQGAGVVEQYTAMQLAGQTAVTTLGENVITTFTTTAGSVITTTADQTGKVVAQYAELANGAILQANGMQEGVLTSVLELGDRVVTTTSDMAGNLITVTTDMTGNVIDRYVKMGDEVTSSVSDMASETSREFRRAGDSARQAVDPINEFGEAMQNIPKPDLGGVISEWKKVTSAIKSAISEADKFSQHTGSKGGSGGKFARASGGPVSAFQSYIVGDGGRPELFVPGVDGYIMPSVPEPLMPSRGGGGGEMQTIRIVHENPDGRTLEEWYVTGQRLAIERGRA